MIGGYKKFLENKNELLDIKDVFIEISDLQYSYYELRNATDGKKYKKVFGLDVERDINDVIIVTILCDYLYEYFINEMIKNDIKPVLNSMGYKISIKSKNSGDYTSKYIPNSSGGTSFVQDPIKSLSVLIKKKVNKS